MPLFQAIFAFVFAPLALAQGTDVTTPSKSSDTLRCEIRSSAVRGGLRLEAVAVGAVGTSGEYELVVARAGSGGTSNVSQGGEFTVEPGQETVLGEVTLGEGTEASLQAHLTVSSADGKTACEDRFPRRL